MRQQTIGQQFEIEGIGLHSGLQSKLVFKPLEENAGIVFRRSDLPDAPMLPALWSNVVDTRNCTCIGDGRDHVVGTIEHLMSALYMRGVDNVLIEVNNPELPIMDGSAAAFYRALQEIPLQEQAVERKYLKVAKEVSFADDKGNKVSLNPYDKGLKIRFEIDFPSKVVGHQVFAGEMTPELFVAEIASCRTFCEKSQVDYLQSIGLIKGGSLENAVVLDGETVLNPEGLRHGNECVNHKVLDAVGDFYTSGYRVLGELNAFKTGHFHNNQLLKVLFGDQSNYELV